MGPTRGLLSGQDVSIAAARSQWQRFSTGRVDNGVRNAGAPVVKGGDYLCESDGDSRAELGNVLCISMRACG